MSTEFGDVEGDIPRRTPLTGRCGCLSAWRISFVKARSETVYDEAIAGVAVP